MNAGIESNMFPVSDCDEADDLLLHPQAIMDIVSRMAADNVNELDFIEVYLYSAKLRLCYKIIAIYLQLTRN